MTEASDSINQNDPFNLERFVSAQSKDYHAVRKELKCGRKETHWMWYIFPQIDGLGYSPTSKRYAIKSKQEAQQYLEHPVLGKNLRECVQLLLDLEGRSAAEIFGFPDDLKLKSSMTLFAYIKSEAPMFARVLDKYFQGERDIKTLNLLDQHTA
ncbi:MAG: DUF1810 domain-containing protein [Chloroflexota bacterium]|nr:DUF1810 domain-containing protein [Chloroflexota bacterium]